jgi:hypothetical protein
VVGLFLFKKCFFFESEAISKNLILLRAAFFLMVIELLWNRNRDPMKVGRILAGIFFVLVLNSCESWFQDIGLKDIKRVDGPCTITLKDGTIIETPYSLEISIRTEAITYRDEDRKLWMVFREEYESYACQ